MKAVVAGWRWVAAAFLAAAVTVGAQTTPSAGSNGKSPAAAQAGSAAPAAASKTQTSTASTAKPGPKGAGTASGSAPKGDLLDINTATVDQLKALPGIGDAYAKRIVAARPYAAKNQLVSRGVVPQATYDKISGMIVAHRVTK